MRSQSGRRRKKRYNSLAIVWILLVVSALVGGGVFLALPSKAERDTQSQWAEWNGNELTAIDAAPSDTRLPAVSRIIYPYSVVPGGVLSAAELREAGQRDRVVSEHYADFDYGKARVVKVREPRLVYLSYRIRNQIYWTTKKVSLHAGETLITDGKVTARARCGNQVSELPQRKASPEEPSVAQLDGPVGSGSSTRIPFPENFHSELEARPSPGFAAPALGPASLLAAGGGSSPLGGGFLPVGSPLVPGSGCCATKSGPGPGGPGGSGGSGTPTVPEPGTLEMVFVEALGALAAGKLLFKKLGK